MQTNRLISHTPHRYLIGALILLTLLTIAGIGYAGGEEPRAVAAPNESQLEMLRERALTFAAINDETEPRNITVVAGPRLKLVELLMSGATVDSDQDMFAVAMEGSFVGHAASTSPRSPEPPVGTHLIILYDAETMKRWDWGLTDRPSPLERFGTPIRLDN